MRVPVIEDARSLADGIAQGLRDHGMAVDVAYEGQDAAAKLDVNAYDVVVLDRDLPGMHGDTICQMIASSGKAVMVLMLTASGSPATASTASASARTTTWPSPSTSPNWCSESALWPAASPRPGPASSAPPGIELDPLRHTAHRDGRQLDLSGKEFAVLEALMRADHAVLSAEDLLEQAWDEHADPFTATVSVTISRLRRKLGNPPVIETIPSVGYRITGSSS